MTVTAARNPCRNYTSDLDRVFGHYGLNMVERWFGLLSEKQIKRGTHRSTMQLEQAIRQCLAIHNENPKPFI